MPLLGVMAEKISFEQLCVRPQRGYVLDEKVMLKFSSPNSFDDVVFKITSKCDTGKLLLSSHKGPLAKFTVDIVPVYADANKKAKVANRGKRLDQEDASPLEENVIHAWEVCKSKGFHGLHVITCLEPSSMPDNGCRANYSLSQFVNSVIHSIEAYYMFQRPDSRFYPDIVHLWNPADTTVSEARGYCVVLVWKFEGDPEDFVPKSPKLGSVSLGSPDGKLQQSLVLGSKGNVLQSETNLVSSAKKRPSNEEISSGVEKARRGRKSTSGLEIPIHRQIEDPDISFNFKSQVGSTVADTGVEGAVSSIAIDDIKLGFEKSAPKTPGRKSTARKSLLPDWPPEEKEGVLEFFDHMNPANTETTRIALTCNKRVFGSHQHCLTWASTDVKTPSSQKKTFLQNSSSFLKINTAMGSNDCEYSSEEEEAWVMYKDRSEWADITPQPQDDGPNPVVRIAYSDTFTDVYDYFRAIVAKGELSERALQLTEDALHMNTANYTVWQYRRKCLAHLSSDLEKELVFCREMIELNPKNYQVWHHRRVIVEWIGHADKELRLTEIIFSQDAKNYHAWEHRQWVLRTFGLYDGELEYVNRLLEEDVRNNSAWNQRYFVIVRTTGYTQDVIKQEVEYTKKAIEKVVNNESPWSYLRGVLQHSEEGLHSVEGLESWCLGLHEAGSTSPFLIAFLIDLAEDTMEYHIEEREGKLAKVLEWCESLATEHDKIRREFWRYMARHISHKYAV